MSFRRLGSSKKGAGSVDTAPSTTSMSGSGEGGSSCRVTTGVKPWTLGSGPGLVSSGHRQLDEILGGGHVLGSTLLLESESHSDYASTLLSYELAEAVAMNHRVIVVAVTSSSVSSEKAQAVIENLPFNINAGADEAHAVPEAPPSAASSASAESQSVGADLTIAWQYSKYLPSNSGKPGGADSASSSSSSSSSSSTNSIASTFCCSYDLAKRFQRSLLDRNRPIVVHVHALTELVLAISRFFLAESSSSNNNNYNYCDEADAVTRVFIPNLEELYNLDDSGSSRDVARTMLQLKHLLRHRRATVTMTVLPSQLPSFSQQSAQLCLANVADTVVSVESFAGRTNAVPQEFQEFVGFLLVHKIQHAGALAASRPPYERYGLKRNRRKLSIEPLHLPPEDSRAFGPAGTDEHLKAKAAAAGLVTTGAAVASQPLPSASSSSSSSFSRKSSSSSSHHIELALEPAIAPSPAVGPAGPSSTSAAAGHTGSDAKGQSPAPTASSNAAMERKKAMANTLAVARAAREALKASAAGGGGSSSGHSTEPPRQPPLAPGSSCSRSNLDF